MPALFCNHSIGYHYILQIILLNCMLRALSSGLFIFLANLSLAQAVGDSIIRRSGNNVKLDIQKQFHSTSAFLDATVSSVNAFNALITKENYRARITSLNNPASAGMGFSLENEIQAALKPLLAKAKNTDPEKFSHVVSSLVTNQRNVPSLHQALALVNPVFPTLMGLVSNLAVQEKRITRQDLDSFIITTSRYFVQYERLNQANISFEQGMLQLHSRLKELQFDTREYILDMITIIYPGSDRSRLKSIGLEELLLQYLDEGRMEEKISSVAIQPKYPADGIKSAKEISSSLQKLFAEYQKIYSDNYLQILSILNDSKTLGKNINMRQIENSIKELEKLYQETRSSDIIGMRLNTLVERLKILVETEQSGTTQ